MSDGSRRQYKLTQVSPSAQASIKTSRPGLVTCGLRRLPRPCGYLSGRTSRPEQIQ